VRKVLFLYVHPNAPASRANQRMLSALDGMENVTCRPLYDLYPEFFIDVKAEQRLLREHDVVVFQHPFYWYGSPPLLKLWMDQVLEYNFAYGPDGNALRGKSLLVSVTAGGSAASYQEGGVHGFPLESFLLPFLQSARMCAMRWEAPVILHQALDANDEALEAHGRHLRSRLEEIQRRVGDN
jgi:glutathione-regulated potassium-efflux system ancillary protein KefG